MREKYAHIWNPHNFRNFMMWISLNFKINLLVNKISHQFPVTTTMDKLKLTGQNLGRVFKSRFIRISIGHELYTYYKTT